MKMALHHLQYNWPSDSRDYCGLNLDSEEDFRQCSAMLLCASAIGLMAVFFTLNFLERKYNLLPALILASVLPVLTLFRLSYRRRAPVLLFLCGLNFIALSSFMFVYEKSMANSSLFLLMLVPPLVAFSLSRYWGACLLLIFFTALGLLLLLTPEQGAGQPLNWGFRARFAACAVLAFAFFMSVEYFRVRSGRLLNQTAKHLQLMAVTDPLTGIGNRRDFQNHLKWLQAQSERSGKPFGVALLEVDHFQRIRDVYGRQLSDALLRYTARGINDALRETDRVFRWSGQQFVLLMPGADLPAACAVVERVRRHMEFATLTLYDGQSIATTISAGVEAWNRAFTLDMIMTNADQRLYLAKKLGRNRVYTGAVNQAVKWFPGLNALPRVVKYPAPALASFPMPVALPARV